MKENAMFTGHNHTETYDMIFLASTASILKKKIEL